MLLLKKRPTRLMVMLACLATAQAVQAEPPSDLASYLDSAHRAACPGLAQSGQPEDLRLRDFYQQRQYRPRWNPARLAALEQQIAGLADDGMPPGRYALPPADSSACSELLSSQRYLQALDELANGILPAPLPEIWHAEAPAVRIDPQAIASQTADDDLAAAFARARPDHPLYRQLRSHYAALRTSTPSPWPLVDPGRLLRSGSQGPRVAQLAARLAAEGYLPEDGITAYTEYPLFDDALDQALRHFQRRHSLQDDGILGPDSLRQLNLPASWRIQQLQINLERWRWLYRELEADLLLVDITAGEATLYRQGSVAWQTRLQVGRPERQTPQLKSRINRLTLNPTWTVPPTIFRKDKLPQIRQDPGYLARNRLRVLDHQGHRLNPASIDWRNPRGILLRQDAGPDNALGQIAFRFQNPFSVYLHDTPSQRLFDKRPRVFSSGCVRVENAMTLRDLLTDSLDAADREQLLQLHDSGKTREYRLQQTTPLLIAYWTVSADEEGLIFRPDLYDLDQAVMEALQGAAGPETDSNK